MANESGKILIESKEEEKLVQYYVDIINNEYKPSSKAQIAFLMQLLNTKITQVENREKTKKGIHYFLRIGILVLSGMSTVLLGLKIDFSTDVVLILTAIITLFSSLATFWDIENYWVRLKVMSTNLKALRYKYTFAVEGGEVIKNGQAKVFLDEFLLIHSDGYWENYLSSLNKIRDTARAKDEQSGQTESATHDPSISSSGPIT